MRNEKITRNEYNKLKDAFLAKNRRSMYSLYIDVNKNNKVSKHLFFGLINKICREAGIKEYYNMKNIKK